jgi:hypothetical protein
MSLVNADVFRFLELVFINGYHIFIGLTIVYVIAWLILGVVKLVVKIRDTIITRKGK